MNGEPYDKDVAARPINLGDHGERALPLSPPREPVGGLTMPWVKIDDAIGEHPKIAALDDHAFALFITGLAYCNRNLTDGFIPSDVGYGQLRYCDGNCVPAIRQLEDIGLWITCDGGWKVHDFHDYQPSRRQILKERKQGSARVSAFREKRRRNAKGNAGSNARVTPTPVPVPVPVPQEHKSITTTATGFVIPDQLLTLWKETYPAIDVRQVVRAAFAWTLANPANKKSNWHRFLVAWLKREQDQAPRAISSPLVPEATPEELVGNAHTEALRAAWRRSVEQQQRQTAEEPA